ncbi:MAG TPA: hypothetical protein VHB79_02590 [Polyangiaceae bacterium]|nr:hypothetical protein [Polyangiaceae bacterium]
MVTKFQLARKRFGCAALTLLVGCTDGSAAQHASGGSSGGGSFNSVGGAGLGVTAGTAGATSSGGASAGSGTNGGGGGGGGVDSPGQQPSACEAPLPAAGFALSSGDRVASPGPYVVLTGTLPPDINGSPVTSVRVAGAARGVRMDAQRKVWSYFLAGATGDLQVVASSQANVETDPLTAHVVVGDAPLPARDIADGQHTVGSWMFTWFTGDTSWECSSAWRPVGGFKSWNGSVAWAREQLLDQLDAHLDAVGLQLDTPASTGNQGYRFSNVVHVVDAARQLLEEGVAPPRLFPFLDTAIIADHYGSMPDLASDAGRAYLYGHAQAFYKAANTSLGSIYSAAGIARFGTGVPAVGFWHSQSMTGVDNAAVLDFKARFQNDFGSSCYFIAHPNDWRNFAAVDEITQMVGPPTHYLKTGHDGAGNPTINLEAGFWNPTSNPFYIPREGGGHFDDAWVSAQAQRASARHIWIDTWNETGEGSGMFAADTLSYAATDAGPCNQFVNKHADNWATEGRHYINVVRTQAAAWNDAADLDAAPLASDAPTSMKPGERRYITVAMQNTGDVTWASAGPQLGLSAAAAADDFHVDAAAAPQSDDLSQRFGGVARGLPGVFTLLVTAPCAAGRHHLELEMIDPQHGRFGKPFSIDVNVAN